ncbi:hypothetical protein [Desulfosporosinus sp. SB140]|uniref:hypothetical protein n=1 Tax=Desulfosporosinus paludis TaxID=3115649 RepID=UPI00388D8B33
MLVKFLDKPGDQTSWMWDEKLVNLLGVLRLNSTESTHPAHSKIGKGVPAWQRSTVAVK